VLSQQLVGCGRGGFLTHQPGLLAHLADHRCERLPLDQLHRVEVYAPVRPDGVDGHDVRVVQQGGRLGLIFEPLQLA